MRVTPLASLTKRIRVMRMRDETGPRSSKDKGSEGHARNSALCAPEGAREMGTETEKVETENCLGTDARARARAAQAPTGWAASWVGTMCENTAHTHTHTLYLNTRGGYDRSPQASAGTPEGRVDSCTRSRLARPAARAIWRSLHALLKALLGSVLRSSSCACNQVQVCLEITRDPFAVDRPPSPNFRGNFQL
jgi:hypothetical protein